MQVCGVCLVQVACEVLALRDVCALCTVRIVCSVKHVHLVSGPRFERVSLILEGGVKATDL